MLFRSRRDNETADHHHERIIEWQQRCERAHNVAEVIIAKQRHGPIGTVKLHFEANFTHFGDHIGDDEVPEQMY